MSELQQFVAELLEERGAAVEPVEPEGLDVLAPPDVRETLGLPEIARLGFAAELPPGARRVGLEPDWLDRLGRLLGERDRSSRLVIEQDLPALSSPERMVEHALQLQNATWRLVGVRPAWTRYLLLTFRCTALSDEKRASVLRLDFGAEMREWSDFALSRNGQATRRDTGMPRPVMMLMTLQATSVFCVGRVRAWRPRPITFLYRNIATSANERFP